MWFGTRSSIIRSDPPATWSESGEPVSSIRMLTFFRASAKSRSRSAWAARLAGLPGGMSGDPESIAAGGANVMLLAIGGLALLIYGVDVKPDELARLGCRSDRGDLGAGPKPVPELHACHHSGSEQ